MTANQPAQDPGNPRKTFYFVAHNVKQNDHCRIGAVFTDEELAKEELTLALPTFPKAAVIEERLYEFTPPYIYPVTLSEGVWWLGNKVKTVGVSPDKPLKKGDYVVIGLRNKLHPIAYRYIGETGSRYHLAGIDDDALENVFPYERADIRYIHAIAKLYIDEPQEGGDV